MEEFFEEEAGEAIGVVADDAVFFEEIVEDDAEAELLERREIDGDGLGALGAVAAGDFGETAWRLATTQSMTRWRTWVWMTRK